MSHLAKQFGISDSGLAKICKRLNVPYPPRGWWAKKEAGKPVRTQALPPFKDGIPASVAISPSEGPEEGLKAAIREKSQEIGEVAVPQRLARSHPLIAGWRENHRRRMEEARRERDPWRRSLYSVPDYTEADRRRHRILQALFNALESHGAAISENDRRQLIATVENEKIEFSLQEKSRQVTRPLNDEEKRWSWNKSGVKTELEPTGYFQFSIKTWIDHPIRKNWLESEKRPLDAMLPEICATFLIVGQMRAERSRVRQEEARINAERQRQLELERQRRQQNENRWKRLLEIADASKRVEVARAFIARLKELDVSDEELIDGRTASEWVAWAEEQATTHDPVRQGVDRIFGDIAQVNAWTYR